MDIGIILETNPIFGICSLCLKEDVVISMLIKKQSENREDSYTDLLFKCFSINITVLDLDDTKQLICNTCIKQLESCFKFKEQVETSLKTLEATIRLKNVDTRLVPRDKREGDINFDNNSDDNGLLVQRVKLEDVSDVDNNSDDDKLLFQSVKQEDDSDFDNNSGENASEQGTKESQLKKRILSCSRNIHIYWDFC